MKKKWSRRMGESAPSPKVRKYEARLVATPGKHARCLFGFDHAETSEKVRASGTPRTRARELRCAQAGHPASIRLLARIPIPVRAMQTQDRIFDFEEKEIAMISPVLHDNLFQDLFDFRRDFDQIFNRILLGKPSVYEEVPRMTLGFVPPVEAYVEKETRKFFCRVYLPGIEPDMLTIKGERKVKWTPKETSLLKEEVPYGAFERTIELPEGVTVEKLTAEYHNGVLEITAPVTEGALPRKIEIKTLPIAKRAAA
jgi:HSP20 family protein